MRIGVVVGICVEQDAISSAACAQAAVLLETPGVTSVDLFTTHLRRPTKCMAHEVAGPWQLLSDPAFRSCDVLIFHWGIFTPLFDAVWSIDFGRQRVAVHFHNVTSPHLVDESRREVIHQSLRQIEALNALPIEIWTFSEFNRRTLVSIGIDGDRIQFVPFPIESPRPVRRTVRTDAVRLLCVGRIVPAKGTDTLIEALGILRLRGGSNYRLWVAGNRSMSSPDYADALNERVEELGLAGSVFFANPDDDGLWSLLESSDIVVSPSLHEGLCVPIIEGYLAGCHAVGTTETNLPFVVQRPDPIVPPNDPVALADAIETLVSELDDPSRRWLRNVEQLCSQFPMRTCQGGCHTR
jgi:glycosyltransferase involved in cell wall biosynthesis